MVTGILLILAVVLALSIPFNLAGWVSVRSFSPKDYPFNWRIFLGPVIYLNWIDR